MLGVIELVSKSTVKNGVNAGNVFYKVQIGGKNFNVFKDSGAFALIDTEFAQTNSHVDFEFGESTPYEYKGKMVTSKHLVSLKVVEAPVSTGPIEVKPVNDADYRSYQIKLMKECFEDSRTCEVASDYVKDVAIAFFEKRCTPIFYAKTEGLK